LFPPADLAQLAPPLVEKLSPCEMGKFWPILLSPNMWVPSAVLIPIMCIIK
jgi:hypothetical protein